MRDTDSQSKSYFRVVDRLYCLNGRWYYQTREADQGPFANRGEAERDLMRYVEEMRHFARDRGLKAESRPVRSLDFSNLALVEWEEASVGKA